MNLEHVRNNWMKISKRVEDMDWGSREVSVGGSNVGAEAVGLCRSPHPTLRGRGGRAGMAADASQGRRGRSREGHGEGAARKEEAQIKENAMRAFLWAVVHKKNFTSHLFIKGLFLERDENEIGLVCLRL